MDKKILFWAHRKDLEHYFFQISSLIPFSEVVARKKVPNTKRLKFPGWKKLFDVVRYEYRSAHANHRYFNWRYILLPLETFILSIQLYSNYMHFLEKKDYKVIIVWGVYRLKQSLLIHAAKTKGIDIVYVENGFFPNTTYVDNEGVNANCSLSRNPIFYTQLNMHHDLRSLPTGIIPRASIKGRVYTDSTHELPERYVFVPFQSNGDSVIIKNSPWIKNMWQLFEVLVKVTKQIADKDIVFIIKEHPSCKVDYKSLYRYLVKHPELNIVFKNDILTETLIKNAQAVFTINSFVGFESLLFSVPVIAAGDEAYCVDGLVRKVKNTNELVEALDLILGEDWKPNTLLRDHFLLYIYNEYLIKGSENQVSDFHIKDMAMRIQRTMNDFN